MTAQEKKKREKIIAFAKQARDKKIPYIWGGQDLSKGLDCSGFVIEVFKKVGFFTPSFDTTADGLWRRHGKKIPRKKVHGGDLCFYGRPSKKTHKLRVTHVMIVTGFDAKGKMYCIGACGGGRGVKTPKQARAKKAYVKQKLVDYRGDLVGFKTMF